MSDLPLPEDDRQIVHLTVGGKVFVLDNEDVMAFDSDFLTKLVSEDSPFRRPEDGMFVVDASAEWFSAFLHLARYDVLPVSRDNINGTDKFLEITLLEADFWGVKDKVSRELTIVSDIVAGSYRKGREDAYKIRD
jgi:BTB/POZ domain